MNWQTVVLVLMVVLWAVAQYGLAVYALRDLKRRPTVRGNNKVVWALVILCIPIAGALFYTVYGPTSFIRRIPTLAAAPASAGRGGPQKPPHGPDDRPAVHRPTSDTSPHLDETRVSQSGTRFRQHAPPVEHLPDIDDDIDEPRPESVPSGATNRLIRQAQRKIRR